MNEIREELAKKCNVASQEPPGKVLFNSSRRRDRWGLTIFLGSLALLAVWVLLIWLETLGVRVPAPETFSYLLLGGVVAVRTAWSLIRWLKSQPDVRYTRGFLRRSVELPPGVTDDLSIPMPSGLTAEKIVELVLSAKLQNTQYEEVVRVLVSLGLSEEDAELAFDRALGGLVRAGTRNPFNEPSRKKDPIAWTSYQRGLREPALAAAIFPELFSK